jgi:hypothetical protein
MPNPTATRVLYASDLRASVPLLKSTQRTNTLLGDVNTTTAAPTKQGACDACKCTICTCGKHHCVLNKFTASHYDPDALSTTYDMNYIGHPNGARRDPYVPKRTSNASEEKFNAKSTNQDAYTKHPVQHSKAFKPVNEGDDLINPNGDRSYSTENRSCFDPKEFSKRASLRPQNKTLNSAPFDGTSTNKSDYQRWNAKPSTPKKPVNEMQNQPENRDFNTESMSQYVPHQSERSQSYKPANRALHNAPFEGESVTKSDYQGFKFGSCPASDLPSGERTSDGHTFYKQQFDGTWAAK